MTMMFDGVHRFLARHMILLSFFLKKILPSTTLSNRLV